MSNNTKYQVFISSTFVDLKKERQQALKALLDADCIPAGMELFPAADMEQFKFIKEIIDYCDYYLLIIGGRYGSLADDGLSFTEKEFDYAVEKGINIIALLHESPDKLPKSKRDTEPAKIRKLKKFREKVRKDRVVKMWKKDSDILGDVSAAINRAMRKSPAIGWVRADTVATEEILREINELRKEKEALTLELEAIKAEITPKIDNLADFNQLVTIKFCYQDSTNAFDSRETIDAKMSLGDIFWLFSPLYHEEIAMQTVKDRSFPNGCKSRRELLRHNPSSTVSTIMESDGLKVDENDFNMIVLHFDALGLIETFKFQNEWSEYSDPIIRLTPKGRKRMLEAFSIKKDQACIIPQQNADIA